MFKINLTQTVCNLDGSEARFSDKALSLKDLLSVALIVVHEGDQTLPADTRLRRVELAKTIRVQDTVTLTLTDVIGLVPLILRNYTHPLVLATFIQALEDSVRPPEPNSQE